LLARPYTKTDFIAKVNALASRGQAFLFVIDFAMENLLVFHADSIPEGILFSLPGMISTENGHIIDKPFSFTSTPPNFKTYKKSFDLVQHEIWHGNTYLLNLTYRSKIETNLSLQDIYQFSKAKYKLYFRDEFTVFSPECFVKIEDGIISSYPMKGTIDATIPDAEKLLLADEKELAEHHTIVDLIRNDLSMVAEDVKVDRFRYIDKVKTHKGELLQMSSKISGKLPEGYQSQLGDIILKLLPAGSITGAPKPKTLEIINRVENYNRSFYTGIFGYFDGKNLDSAVMIRFIENENGQLNFKSGGGITSMSEAKKEYDELIQKIYVPINRNH
jgi:para-aminobenzoate synthetase component 1